MLQRESTGPNPCQGHREAYRGYARAWPVNPTPAERDVFRAAFPGVKADGLANFGLPDDQAPVDQAELDRLAERLASTLDLDVAVVASELARQCNAARESATAERQALLARLLAEIRAVPKTAQVRDLPSEPFRKLPYMTTDRELSITIAQAALAYGVGLVEATARFTNLYRADPSWASRFRRPLILVDDPRSMGWGKPVCRTDLHLQATRLVATKGGSHATVMAALVAEYQAKHPTVDRLVEW